MRSLCNIIAVVVMMAFACSCGNAQKRVEYYKYVKSIYLNNKSVTMAQSEQGQFITRDGNSCFESDKYGNTVGNGEMKLTARDGNNVKYVGSSYYGSNSHFTFFDDKGVLNVEAMGFVYVYKRSTPPKGVTTSSFIKEDSPAYVPPTIPSMPSSINNSSGSTGGNYEYRNPATKTKCPICNGTGRCDRCGGDGNRIIDLGIRGNRINECGSCRGSGRCNQCHGRGYIR